jgi:hypothetical protein
LCVWSPVGGKSGLGEPVEECPRVDPERARAVAAFLHDQRGKLQAADQPAVFLEIARDERPGAGGVGLRRVEAQGHDQEAWCERRAGQGAGQCFPVARPVQLLG